MAASYATVEQYVARYGIVDDVTMLAECLEDATATINAVLAARYKSAADVDSDVLMRVCRSVASRIMPASVDGWDAPVGVTQVSTTVGPYQQTYSRPYTYSTPRLTEAELSMLGLGGSRAGWAPLAGSDHDQG